MTPPSPGYSQPQAPCLGEKDSTALNNQRPVAAADARSRRLTSGENRWESLRLRVI